MMSTTSNTKKADTRLLAVSAVAMGFVGFLGYKLWNKNCRNNGVSDNDKKGNVVYVPLKELKEFEIKMFQHFGIPKEDAIIAAEILCESDKRGIDSHGVARLQIYFEKLCKNLVNTRPKIKIIRESETTATIDGDNGLGLVVAPKANNIAIEKALKYGSGFVAVCNSNHFGIAGYYALKALEKNCIGLAMCNTSPLVAPTHGIERMLGTNPISVSFPGDEQDPIIIDMSSSTVPFGKIEESHRKQEMIPDGWCMDKNGNPINDPYDMIYNINGAVQLPLGSTLDGKSYKGYCLSSIVDIFCGPLSGANYNKHVEPFCNAGSVVAHKESRGKGRGHFFGAFRIDGFRDVKEFGQHIDKWRTDLSQSKALPNKQVLVPGDPEMKAQKLRSQTGIPVKYAVITDLLQIAKYCNIDLPQVLQDQKL